MRLTFEWFDGRAETWRDVTDQDTGRCVGFIRANGVGPYNSGGIHVNLFDDKYTGHMHRYDEVVGFVRGVEAVLRHLTYVSVEVTATNAA